jgi:hypothetical protein
MGCGSRGFDIMLEAKANGNLALIDLRKRPSRRECGAVGNSTVALDTTSTM